MASKGETMVGQIEWSGDLQRVTLGKNDVLVLSVDRVLSMDAAAKIAAMLEHYFPEHKVLIIDSGAHLGVAGIEDVDPLRHALLKVWTYVKEGRSQTQIIEVIAGALGVSALVEE